MNKLLLLPLRIVTMVLFLAIVPLLLFFEEKSSIVWTILIPLLPLGLLIIGFSRWREICPLAIISKISQKLNLFKKRKVPKWFEANFWYLQYGLLFIALTLRLTTLNFNTDLLALFFIGVIVAAFGVNLFFTGKSWCNFFCPVAAVEKIYTLSNAKNYNLNSACGTCTACKKNCPDIDLESNYWKEGTHRQKTFVFYSFPGMVLGFYLYFYLQNGSLSYYFSGEWTHNSLTLLTSGFFFAPFVPVVLAAPLTLAIFSLLSYLFFQGLEQLLWSKKVFQNTTQETTQHRVKAFASFTAFNIFYIFAGAPSYSNYPLAYALFYFLVVSISSIILYKEIFRKESYFIQERFALKLIKRWDATKKIPSNLKEIYYTYVSDTKNKKDRLKMYKSSVTELLEEGILNEHSMRSLEKLREQIGITKQDHERILREIRMSNQKLFDDSVEKSAEKTFQEKSYKKLIESALNERLEVDKNYLDALQVQFCISDEVHSRIMDSIITTDSSIQKDILDLLDTIYELIKIQKSIYEDGTREILFLKYSVKNEFIFASKDLFSTLFTIYKNNHDTLKKLLYVAKERELEAPINITKEDLNFLDEKIANKMLLIYQDFTFSNLHAEQNNNKEIIKELLNHKSLQIAIAALLNTKYATDDLLTDAVLNKFDMIDDIEVQSLLYKLKYNTPHITTYEKMMYINYIPLFNDLHFDDLHLLGQISKVVTFETGSYILRQGELGNTLYMIIRGAGDTIANGEIVYKFTHRDYFGEIALLGDTLRTASIRVTEPTIALTITKKEFKKFLENNPKVSAKVMKEIIKKLT